MPTILIFPFHTLLSHTMTMPPLVPLASNIINTFVSPNFSDYISDLPFHLGFQTTLAFQLARSNSRRNMPSQSDEEAHQLSYLQKHLGNILSLLSESVEGDCEESLVCEF
ncbi:hypothetical protein MTR67_012545 [Solanum verrucosum]|uniref:Uncharacterized protein n=1 Tax=Solanum verrucosum TaxID=315347 RepID=A0AAF0QBI1_SOLVR|nr:hypothetical protein MTR67_012545 [Solanum verrucosum]